MLLKANLLRAIIAAMLAAATIFGIAQPAAQAGGIVTDCSNQSQFATLVATGGSVSFACGTAQLNIINAKVIDVDTVVDGGNTITLNGQDTYRLFVVHADATLTLRNIILTGGYTSGDGGAIHSVGTVILEHATIRDSHADLSGGAIFSQGPLTMTDSLLEGNTAFNGGALFPRYSSAPVHIISSILRDNHADPATGLGGAILTWDGGIVTLDQSQVYSNSASAGGGIYNDVGAVGSTLYLRQGTRLFGNSAANGGGVYNDPDAYVFATDVVFERNTAVENGGGLYNGGDATFTRFTFDRNSADGEGGGVHSEFPGAGDFGELRLTAGVFISNTAHRGGALSNTDSAWLTNVQLISNTAAAGGGLYNLGGGIGGQGEATLTGVAFSGNRAIGATSLGVSALTPALGGAINNQGIEFIDNSTLSGNTAGEFGGGLYDAGASTLTNVTLSGNIADSGGGVFRAGSLQTKAINVTLSGNAAGVNGAGLYVQSGTLALTGTVVANSPTGGNCFGALVNNGFNFSSDNSCSFGAGRDNVAVLLGVLADNGGPTLTHLPQPGSPLIDNQAVNCPPPATDQRGGSRPVNGDGLGGAACDVGAVEVGAIVSWLYLPFNVR